MNFYISGTSGSGKSTLAKQLAQRFQLTHIELDAFHFDPNWVERPDVDFIRDVSLKMQEGPWVICGNYKEILALALEKVDHLIWLDYPLPLIFWRVTKRTLRRLIKKEKCCGDNYERWSQQFFTQYSIFLWVLKTYRKNKRRYENISKYSPYSSCVRRIRSPRELENFLRALEVNKNDE